MPKDRAEVQDQYKIGGGSLNEFEFDQSKGEMEERAHARPEGEYAEGLRGAAEPNAPQNVAERIQQVEQRAHEIVERRRAKSGAGGKGAAKKGSKKGAAAGAKGGAKKGARKGGAAGSAKGGAAKKGAAKSSSGKKSAAGGAKKASGAKKSAKKGAAGGRGAKGGAKKGAAKKGSRARK